MPGSASTRCSSRTSTRPSRFRRINYNASVRPKIYERMISEGCSSDDEAEGMDFEERVRCHEIRLITRALQETGNNQTLAARKLRIPLRTLVFKIGSYGIR